MDNRNSIVRPWDDYYIRALPIRPEDARCSRCGEMFRKGQRWQERPVLSRQLFHAVSTECAMDARRIERTAAELDLNHDEYVRQHTAYMLFTQADCEATCAVLRVLLDPDPKAMIAALRAWGETRGKEIADARKR